MVADGEEVLMGPDARTAVRCLAAIGLVIGGAACGGGSDNGATETESVPAEQVAAGSALGDPQLVELAEGLAADVGVDAVFGTVAFALDRGYSVDQLANAVGSGAVSANGLIVGVDPAREPFGLLVSDDDGVQSFRRSAAPTVPVEELAEAIEPMHQDFDWRRDLDVDLQDNIVLAGVLLTLVEMGYSFDQVVEGVIFGELSVRYATERVSSSSDELETFGCLALADGTGAVVVPNRELVPGTAVVGRAHKCGLAAHNGQLLTAEEAAREVQADRDEAAPVSVPQPDTGTGDPSEADSLDGTYTGTLSYPSDIYIRLIDGTIEISIVDGEAEVTVDYTAWENLEYSSVDDDAPKCAATSRQVWSGTGTAGPPLSAALTQVSVDIIGIEGTCATPVEEHLPHPGAVIDISLGYADDVFSGTFVDIIDVTAQRT